MSTGCNIQRGEARECARVNFHIRSSPMHSSFWSWRMTLPLYYRGIPEQSATSGPKREISSTPTLKRGVPFSKGSKYPDEVIERERAVELPYMVKIAFKVPIPSTTSICMCGAIKTDTIPSSFIDKWRNRPHPLEKCENFYRSPSSLKMWLCPCAHVCVISRPPLAQSEAIKAIQRIEREEEERRRQIRRRPSNVAVPGAQEFSPASNGREIRRGRGHFAATTTATAHPPRRPEETTCLPQSRSARSKTTPPLPEERRGAGRCRFHRSAN